MVTEEGSTKKDFMKSRVWVLVQGRGHISHSVNEIAIHMHFEAHEKMR